MSQEFFLRISILKTLAYFDLTDYPLTKEELFSWLWQPPVISYADFLQFLSLRGAVSDEAISSQGDRHASLAITEKSNYYFLPGREKIVAERQRKFLISEEKLKIAKKAAKKIMSIPFLRAIFVCNSVGARQADEDSDIDFFIVTDIKRVWIVRFFTNLILRLLGLRTYGKKNKNKICLSFFVDTNHLDLAPLRATEQDIHFACWVQQMLPVYDPQNYYAQFLRANSWIKKFIPYMKTETVSASSYALPNSKIGLVWKKIWEKMWHGAYGDAIEKQAKEIQWLKMKPAIKEKSRHNDNGVVISDAVLKFHENDTRIKYKEDWEKLCVRICKN